ncbi:hypothetical protein MYX07_04710 [Patescibacteria group bacterium AH-259-L07]|nr:hypothetical protein [Patescibacteria group bacterium AH-259-L07]
MRKFKKIGLIGDSGGFAAGAYQVGDLMAIEARDLVDSVIYVQGSSISAINFLKWIEQGGQASPLKEIWVDDIEGHRRGKGFIFDYRGIVKRLRSSAILSDKGLRSLLRNIDYQTVVNNSDIQFDVVTKDENAACQKIFSTRDKKVRENPRILKKIVLASVSIEGVFPPVRIGNRYYSDEGKFSIGAALDAGCKTIFVFLNKPLRPKKPWKETWINRIFLSNQYNSYQLKQQEIAQYKNKLKDRLVVFQVRNPVKTLSTHSFRKPSKSGSKRGSISRGIDIKYQESLEILDSMLK